MPKVDIDYANTLFYKISCKDTNITDVYIGHTTNFVQRKSGHKQGCNNPKSSNYACKLYTVIRQHGGWDNWRMDIIAYHECKDHYEARKKEQEYFILYNATLNSIEPMPRPRCVNNQTPLNNDNTKSNYMCDICNFSCFNTQDVFNIHLTRNRHITAVSRLNRLSANFGDKLQKVGNKFECKTCYYICSNKNDFAKHCLTKKHNAILSGDNAIQTIFSCNCGNTYKHRPSYYRHKKNCSNPDVEQPTTHLDMDKPPLTAETVPQFDAALVLELLKQNQEFKELLAEQNKHMIEQQQQLIEAVNRIR